MGLPRRLTVSVIPSVSHLSPNRDTATVRASFRKAIRTQDRAPVNITLNGCAASHWAAGDMQQDGLLPNPTRLRYSKYLNSLIEQNHRGIKSRTRSIFGPKNYASALVILRRANTSKTKLHLYSGMLLSPHTNVGAL
jgi:transposase-like protein